MIDRTAVAIAAIAANAAAAAAIGSTGAACATIARERAVDRCQGPVHGVNSAARCRTTGPTVAGAEDQESVAAVATATAGRRIAGKGTIRKIDASSVVINSTTGSGIAGKTIAHRRGIVRPVAPAGIVIEKAGVKDGHGGQIVVYGTAQSASGVAGGITGEDAVGDHQCSAVVDSTAVGALAICQGEIVNREIDQGVDDEEAHGVVAADGHGMSGGVQDGSCGNALCGSDGNRSITAKGHRSAAA